MFVVAAAAKLADRAGSRQTLVDFGVPAWLAPPLGTLLPVAELAVAVTLLPVTTARWGAVGALALLAVFTAAVALSLVRGKAPACRCFGQLTAAPVGPRTLARNGVLLAVAMFVAVAGWHDPGPGVLSPIAALSRAEQLAAAGGVSLLLLGAIVALLFVEMMRQQGRILLRLEAIEHALTMGAGGAFPSTPAAQAPAAVGLAVGAPAPPFRLKDLHGTTVELSGLLALGRPLLLLFVHPRCGPCEALMPEIAQWQRTIADVLTMTIISEGAHRENRTMASQHGIATVLRQRASEVGEAYQAYGTPSAVLVHADGTIGSSVASGADAVRALVQHALAAPALPWEPQFAAWAPQNGHAAGSPSPAGRLRPGDVAPGFALPDLDGRVVRLEDTPGERLLVSWNPSCGFCQQLLTPLKAWEAKTLPSTRSLLIVAQGETGEMAAAGFRSTVVMDRDASVSRSFGLTGTPMAVLLDARGRVVSETAVGADAVLVLAEHGTGEL